MPPVNIGELSAALGNRKQMNPKMGENEQEPEDNQGEEDAKFADLEARVAALEAKVGVKAAGPPVQ